MYACDRVYLRFMCHVKNTFVNVVPYQNPMTMTNDITDSLASKKQEGYNDQIKSIFIEANILTQCEKCQYSILPVTWFICFFHFKCYVKYVYSKNLVYGEEEVTQ